MCSSMISSAFDRRTVSRPQFSGLTENYSLRFPLPDYDVLVEVIGFFFFLYRLVGIPTATPVFWCFIMKRLCFVLH